MLNDGQEIDVDAPFIAKDGLEYEDLAAFILGRPANCWRNRTIQDFRRVGRSEEAIREWIKGFDGADPTPSLVLDKERATTQGFERATRALLARAAAGHTAIGESDFSF